MKKGINVLSLFDGMSCGQLALEKAGVKVNNYFASEIDKNAILVAKDNFPNIQHLGCVTKIDLDSLPKIDLIIGGSPCQGFSFAGKQLNFEDSRSKLFFNFVDILNKIKEVNPNVNFLLENVKMKQEFQNIISEALGVKPVLINSNLISAQNRARLYWSNLEVSPPKDKGIILEDIVDKEVKNYEYIPDFKVINKIFTKNYLQYDPNNTGHRSQSTRAFYLKGKSGCMDTFSSRMKILEKDGRVRKLTRNEGERLQTIDDNYTRAVSKNQAMKMLGNGWTIDVIAHIFKELA